MTVAEARETVRQSPGKYRAAVVWAPSTPILDHPEARVLLHKSVKDASDDLKARKESLVKSGWRLRWGSLGKSVLVFEREGDKLAVCIDKKARKARSPEKSGGNQLSADHCG